MRLNDEVRAFWEREPCGTGQAIVGPLAESTREWFERVEEHRYRAEPYIHSVAQFTRHRGKRVLEVGVGAGTDHLQWARAGAECWGVDLTEAALRTTREHLALYGLGTRLQRVNAERLPFADETFDLVYSWGVIHHSERPEAIVAEILRILKKGGEFIGMMYGRRSPAVFKIWVKQALLKGKPWRSFTDLVWHHVESIGTKAYTVPELRRMFSAFSRFSAQRILTIYDTDRWPRWISRWFPDDWGWFISIKATR